jgi:branched-chain amino acid transport system substrate-binding protein
VNVKTAALAVMLACAGLCISQPACSEILIAVAGPMTGAYAAYGAQMRAGAEAAVEDINQSGGLIGQQLALIVADDACERDKAIEAAHSLVRQKVALVAGHFCSSASIAAAAVYAQADIVQISPASADPRLTDTRAGPNIFRLAGRSDRQGEVAGKYLAERFSGKRIAILHDRTSYGRGLADAVRKSLHEARTQESLFGSIAAGEKDYRATVSKIKMAGVDVVYLGGFPTEAALIAREFRMQRLETKLVSGDALATPDYWELAGEAGNGTLLTFLPDERKSPHARGLVQRLRNKHIEPQRYVLYTYAAIEVWAAAVAAAQSVEAKTVTRRLSENAVDSSLGAVSFDKKGDSDLAPFKIYEWRDGTIQQIN